MKTVFIGLCAIWGIAAAAVWREGRRIAAARRKLEDDRRSFSTDRGLLRALLAQSTDHIYFKDAAGRFLLVSASLARSLGVENPDDLVGKSDFDFFGRLEVFGGEDAEKQVLRTGRPLAPYVRAKRWPDGQISWKSTCKWPLVDDQGHVWGTFGISRDVAPPENGKEGPQGDLTESRP